MLIKSVEGLTDDELRSDWNKSLAIMIAPVIVILVVAEVYPNKLLLTLLALLALPIVTISFRVFLSSHVEMRYREFEKREGLK